MFHKLFRIVSFPFRWVIRFGLGGKTRSQKLLRRSWLAAFCVIVIGLPLIWTGLAIRYHTLRPANQFAMVDKINASNRTLPGDAAWKDYEAALAGFTSPQLTPNELPTPVTFINEYDLLLDENFRDSSIKFVSEHQATMLAIDTGLAKADLGIQHPRTFEAAFDEGTFRVFWGSRASTTLDFVKNVQRLRLNAAAETGGGAEAVRIIRNTARLAEHLSQIGSRTFRFGNRNLTGVVQDTTHLVLRRPKLFDDEQLRELQRFFSELESIKHTDSHEDYIDNILDKMYSESGAWTPHGTDLLASLSPLSMQAESAKLLTRPTRTDRWVGMFILPIQTLRFPTRTDLRQHLLDSIHEYKSKKLTLAEIERDRRERLMEPLLADPEWTELPMFVLEHWLPLFRGPDTGFDGSANRTGTTSPTNRQLAENARQIRAACSC